MSKKRTSIYNRQTTQYRKNLYRGELNRAGVKAPKMRNNRKLKIMALLLGTVWVVLSVAALFISREFALLVLFIGVVGAAVLAGYYTREDKKNIEAYIKLGLTKENFNEALKKRRTDPKQIRRINKLWDKTEEKIKKNEKTK